MTVLILQFEKAQRFAQTWLKYQLCYVKMLLKPRPTLGYSVPIGLK